MLILAYIWIKFQVSCPVNIKQGILDHWIKDHCKTCNVAYEINLFIFIFFLRLTMSHTCWPHTGNVLYVTLTFLHFWTCGLLFLENPFVHWSVVGGHGIFSAWLILCAGFLYFLYAKSSKGKIRCADRVITDPEPMDLWLEFLLSYHSPVI